MKTALSLPYHLKHRKTGLFVCARGWEMTLEADPIAAPLFTAENTGPARRDDWHRQFAANARKRWPGQIVRNPVTSQNAET